MKEDLQKQIADLREQLNRGEIDRRQFLVAATLLGVSLSEALAGCGPKATVAPATAAPAAATEPPAAATAAPAAATEPPAAAPETQAEGWGMENYPYPTGAAYIECVEMKCVGCGICEMACAMNHFGVINKDLARIQVRKYMLPLPKAVQVTCAQCPEQERECQKACPVDPPAIYFDEDTLHMVIDKETCLGEKCMQCQEACSAKAVRIYPSVSPIPFVCDLCDTENTGNRDPQCVNVCPYGALNFTSTTMRFNYVNHDIYRKHADEKAELIAKRMYPLPKDLTWKPGW
jgi:carbon-monoxide dehydrogenase iron sulfur subunit